LPKNVDDIKNILYNKKHNIGIKWECVNTNYELGIDFY